MNKKKTMTWFIWKTMMISFAGLAFLFLIINLTVFSQFKTAFFYEQLEEEAEYKKQHASNEGHANIYHFVLRTSNEMYEVESDNKTRKAFEKDWDIIVQIADDIVKKTDEYGNFVNDGERIFYYAEKINTQDYMVFIKSDIVDSREQLKLIGFAVFMISFSYFIAKYLAKKISNPIKELELFSEEISKKNWKTNAPNLNTLEFCSLSKTLDKTKHSLEIADKRDREFLHNTSHDLKTPVMVIKGYAQAMIDGVKIKDTSAPLVIKEEADRLERKITQLLRLNTLDYNIENQNEWKEVHLGRVLSSIVSKLEMLNTTLSWHLDLEDLVIEGDSESLVIAFENILENQLRYAKQDITIEMTSSKVIIGNDGPKFECDPMLLFEQYQKKTLGQNGLGLAIAKKVIVSHGGKVTAGNTENGVEFIVMF